MDINLCNKAVNVISFSKECTAPTKQELKQNIDCALNASIERLKELNIIPQTLVIKRSDYIYQLSQGKVGSKVDVNFKYYNLNSNTFEQNSRIYEKIRNEHQLRKLKEGHSCTLVGTFKRKTVPKPERLQKPKITLRAETLEALTLLIKDKIYNNYIGNFIIKMIYDV